MTNTCCTMNGLQLMILPLDREQGCDKLVCSGVLAGRPDGVGDPGVSLRFESSLRASVLVSPAGLQGAFPVALTLKG